MLARNANEAFGLGVHIPHEVSQVRVAAHLGDDTVEFQVRLRTVGLFLNRLSHPGQGLAQPPEIFKVPAAGRQRRC